MSDSDRPIKAKITSVVTAESDGINADSVMVRFTYEGEERTEDFGSPLLNEENMRMWRRLVLSVVLDDRVSPDDRRIQIFGNYKSVMEGRDVYIAFDGAEVHAIGRNPKHMFFPYEYGLWDTPKEGK